MRPDATARWRAGPARLRVRLRSALGPSRRAEPRVRTAFVAGRRPDPGRGLRTRPAAVRWLALAAALAGTAVVAIRRRWLVVTVVGTSMLPALRPGDVVLARRRDPAGLAVGEVIVLDPPDGSDRPPVRRPQPGRTWLVKRVAARPGERLPYDRTAQVPPATVAVLGDNGGHDSRVFGPLPYDRVVGVVVRRLRAAP